MKRGPQYPHTPPRKKLSPAEIEAAEPARATPAEMRAAWKRGGYEFKGPAPEDVCAPGKPCPEDAWERPCKHGCGEGFCMEGDT